MAQVNDYECIHMEQAVCGHPKLVGTDDWPGEVSPGYCSRCLFREPIEPDDSEEAEEIVDPLDGAEVGNDCY